MLECARCGTSSPAGTVFCTHCGARMEREAAAVPGTVPGGPISGALEVGAAAPAAPLAPPAGAPRPKAQEHLPPGTVIDGKYSIQRVLGEGGMGVVYLARDLNTGLDLVLKAVRSELAHRKDVRERTLAEGRALAQIDHVNVVHLNAVVADAQSLWLVMQYIDGESLEQTIGRYVQKRQPMPLAEALRILRQILAGVGAAHGEGVIHRDLKPANVLIRRKDGTIKVTDFGIAKVEEDARAGRGATKGIIGSLWYMSPEQVTGRRDLDKRVDVYALGIVLYEMLVGRVPFDAESDYEIMRMHAEAPVPWVSKMRRDIPASVDEVIQRACAKDREQRFADTDEFARALDGLEAKGPAAPIAASPPEPSPRPGARAPRSAADPDARSGATTGHGAELPAPPGEKKGRSWAPAAIVVLALGGGAAALVATGVIPTEGGGGTPSPATPSSGRVQPTATAPATGAPTAAGTSAPARPPLEALAGAWVGNGRELEAVLVGDALEFRVKSPAQFAPQDYQAGEARFILRPIAGETSTFAVEDHIRPIPPPDARYAPQSRGACQEVWSEAGGKPLRATFDGTRLSVEFAKIEPRDDNFVRKGGEITSCVRLRSLRAGKVISLLQRP